MYWSWYNWNTICFFEVRMGVGNCADTDKCIAILLWLSFVINMCKTDKICTRVILYRC